MISTNNVPVLLGTQILSNWSYWRRLKQLSEVNCSIEEKMWIMTAAFFLGYKWWPLRKPSVRPISKSWWQQCHADIFISIIIISHYHHHSIWFIIIITIQHHQQQQQMLMKIRQADFLISIIINKHHQQQQQIMRGLLLLIFSMSSSPVIISS